MSSEFLAFADQALASDTFRLDRPLVQRLRAAMDRLASLASEVAEPTVETAVGHTRHHVASARPGEPKAAKPVLEARALEPRGGVPLGEVPPNGVHSEASTTPGDIPLSPNIFGNGWLDRIPALMRDPDLSHLPGADVHPLGIKLVRIVHRIAYYGLSGSLGIPPDVIQRLFGYSLRYHTKEELLFNARWFLGPGSHELYRLANASFFSGRSTRVALSAARAELNLLDPAVERDAVQDFGTVSSDDDLIAAHPFLNAAEVDTYLRGMGVRAAGADIMELAIPKREPESPGSGDAGRIQIGRQLEDDMGGGGEDLFGLVEYFDASDKIATMGSATEEHAATRGATMKVSRCQLMKNLVCISVCLASGPGFRRAWIDQALAAAAVKEASRGSPQWSGGVAVGL
ncbi:hypothetical protein GQ53DRAFT_741274 [Thozetella sp. PMI_491]|nr:hypothetical protein GQ53DRAFT_741274 [Thozetella sp. PMI_491]